MTDTKLRGLILRAFYDRRKSSNPEMPTTAWIDGETSNDEICRICKQLSEHSLISWTPFIGSGGIGEITAHGVDVVEGQQQADIAIQLVHNYTANITNSKNVIVGSGNRQDATTATAFEELLRAINAHEGSDREKESSKVLLAKLAQSPVFAQVIGQLTRFGLDRLC